MSSANRASVAGVSSDGLRSTALPAAIAPAYHDAPQSHVGVSSADSARTEPMRTMCPRARSMGKLKGLMMSTTPLGSLWIVGFIANQLKANGLREVNTCILLRY